MRVTLEKVQKNLQIYIPCNYVRLGFFTEFLAMEVKLATKLATSSAQLSISCTEALCVCEKCLQSVIHFSGKDTGVWSQGGPSTLGCRCHRRREVFLCRCPVAGPLPGPALPQHEAGGKCHQGCHVTSPGNHTAGPWMGLKRDVVADPKCYHKGRRPWETKEPVNSTDKALP